MLAKMLFSKNPLAMPMLGQRMFASSSQIMHDGTKNKY